LKRRVLVFGSINTDLVTYVDALPTAGETVTGGKFMSFPGGKGANQAVAAARAGAEVEMFGCLGNDSLGRERMMSLKNAGVSTRSITVKAGVHSGIAQIIVDKKGVGGFEPPTPWSYTPSNILEAFLSGLTKLTIIGDSV